MYAEYIENTYVGRRQGYQMCSGRYEIEAWNCFHRTLFGDPRTNNAIEGWHTMLNGLFPRASLPMSQFIIRVQKEEERTRNIETT